MNKISLLSLCLSLLFLVGCSKVEKVSVTGVPIQISHPGEEKVDIEKVLIQASELVKKHFPDAYYGDVGFNSTCADFSLGKGELVFLFMQVKPRILSSKPQVIWIYVTVDTNKMTLDLSEQDMTDFYPSLDSSRQVDNQMFYKVLASADEHLRKMGINDCDLQISQLKETWDVSCYLLDREDKNCQFSIDPETFEVLNEYKPPR